MPQVSLYKTIGFIFLALALGTAVSRFPLIITATLILAAVLIFFYFCTEISFYLLVAYLPFQLALNIYPDIDLLSGRLLILALFVVFVVKCFRTKIIFWQKDQMTLALAAFFFIAAISVLPAQNQIWGLRKLLVFLSVFPMFFLTKYFMRCSDQIKKILWVIAGSSAVSASVALGQFCAQFVFGRQALFDFWSKYIAPFFWGQSFGQVVVQNPSWLVEINGQAIMRAIGLFPDPHMLAFFLGLSAPLVLVLLFYEKKYRLFLFTVFCLQIIVLLLTFSRGGYLGLAASLLAVLFFGWRRFDRKLKIFISSSFFILAVLVILTPVFGRLYSSFNLAEGSNLARLAIWEESLRESGRYLITGVGLGNYPLELDFNTNYRSAVTSHNLYLDVFVETGIFGLLAWLWFLGRTAMVALFKAKDQDNFLAMASIGLLGSVIYFIVHSFFETAVFNPTVLAFLMMVAGLIASIDNFKENKI